MCFGYSDPHTNNYVVTFPISYINVPICCLLGQGAPTNADSATNTWDISIWELATTHVCLWARWGHTPRYHWLVIGS